jgi:uncharacterized protein
MIRGRALILALAAALAPAVPAALPAVRSMTELRREGVVKQGWDLSCGAAALSTILTYHLRDPVPEQAIVDALLRTSDAAKIRARGGFSLLDLKRYATSRGYEAKGLANLSLAQLASAGVAIVPTMTAAGPHFMVFRGVAGGRVLLADPSYGSRTLLVDEFERIWTPRVAFVVRRPGATFVSAGQAPLVPPRVVREAVGVAR